MDEISIRTEQIPYELLQVSVNFLSFYCPSKSCYGFMPSKSQDDAQIGFMSLRSQDDTQINIMPFRSQDDTQICFMPPKSQDDTQIG